MVKPKQLDLSIYTQCFLTPSLTSTPQEKIWMKKEITDMNH